MMNKDYNKNVDRTQIEKQPFITQDQSEKTNVHEGHKFSFPPKILKTIGKVIVAAALLAPAVAALTLFSVHKFVKINFTEKGKAFTKARTDLKTTLRKARFEAFATACTTVNSKYQLNLGDLDHTKKDSVDSHINTILHAVNQAKHEIKEGKSHKKAYKRANDLIAKHLELALTSNEYKEAMASGQPLDQKYKFLNELCAEMHVHENDAEEIAKNALHKFAKTISELGLEYPVGKSKTTIQELQNEIDQDAQSGKPVDLEKAANLLDSLVSFSEDTHYSTHNLLENLFGRIAHPMRTIRSIQSEHPGAWGSIVGEFSSFKTGNPNIPWFKASFKFKENDNSHEFRHIIAANSTIGGGKDDENKGVRVDPRYLAVLKHYEDHPNSPLFLAVQLQKPRGEEGLRVKAMVDEATKHENLHVNNYVVDGDLFEGIALLNNGKYESSQYHTKLKDTYFKEDAHIHDADKYSGKLTKKEMGEKSGILIQNQITDKTTTNSSEKRTTSALDQTEKLMGEKTVNKNFRGLSDARKARMHQYTFQLISTMGEMLTAVKNNQEVIYQENCKEDIDRGATKNALTALATAILAGEELDSAKLLDIFAPILGRAEATNDRAIIRHRLEPFLDLLKCMKSEDLKAALEAHLTAIDCMPTQINMSNLFEKKEQSVSEVSTQFPDDDDNDGYETAVFVDNEGKVIYEPKNETDNLLQQSLKITTSSSNDKAIQYEEKILTITISVNEIFPFENSSLEDLQSLDKAIRDLERIKEKSGVSSAATGEMDQILLKTLKNAKEKRKKIAEFNPTQLDIQKHDQLRLLGKIYAISTHVGPTIYKKGTSRILRFIKSLFNTAKGSEKSTPMNAIFRVLESAGDSNKIKLIDVLTARTAIQKLKAEITGPDHDMYNLKKNENGSYSLIEGYNPETAWLPKDCDAALALLDGLGDSLMISLTPAELQTLSTTALQALTPKELNLLSTTQLLSLSIEQLQAFTPAQLQSLSINQLKTIQGELSAKLLQKVGTEDLGSEAQAEFIEANRPLVQSYTLVLGALFSKTVEMPSKDPNLQILTNYQSVRKNDQDKPHFEFIKDIARTNLDNWTITNSTGKHSASEFIAPEKHNEWKEKALSSADLWITEMEKISKELGGGNLAENLIQTSTQAVGTMPLFAFMSYSQDEVLNKLGIRFAEPTGKQEITRQMNIDLNGETTNTISMRFEFNFESPNSTTAPILSMNMKVGFKASTALLAERPFDTAMENSITKICDFTVS